MNNRRFEDSRDESNHRLWRYNDLHGIWPPFSALHEPGFPQSTEYDQGSMCFARPWTGIIHEVFLLLFESVEVGP